MSRRVDTELGYEFELYTRWPDWWHEPIITLGTADGTKTFLELALRDADKLARALLKMVKETRTQLKTSVPERQTEHHEDSYT